MIDRIFLFKNGEYFFLTSEEDGGSHSTFFTEKELEKYFTPIPSPKKQWVPEKEEEYWFFSDEGDPIETHWITDDWDMSRLLIGNVHKTQEEAEAYKQRLIEAHKNGVI